MKYIRLVIVWMLIAGAEHSTFGQNYGFPLRSVSIEELSAKVFPRDTTASAVVLNEFGEAYILEDFQLMLSYHIKIKILKKSGYEHGNFEVLLSKDFDNKHRKAILQNLVASTFNLEGGSIRETKLEATSLYIEDHSNYDLAKFALPALREGSIIDVAYDIITPFYFNFWPWKFQSSIPKVYSEFHAKIPGNYIYNISLRGTVPLSKNESAIVKDCFSPYALKADCAVYHYAMKDIPAFREEPYMTAKSNFMAMIDFELSEIKHFDGQVTRYTKSWGDVDKELLDYYDFGGQVKKARRILESEIKSVSPKETDPLAKAKSVYRYMTTRYRWNEKMGKYGENGVKKAFETKLGNVGDINLSLVAGLQIAGFDAYPVILSTRANGLAKEVHPVVSDYNYVVAGVEVGGQQFLLDATEQTLPFGLLPVRCINGKGRKIAKESGWIDLKPIDKQKKVVTAELKLTPEGTFVGLLTNVYYGYEAAETRQKILLEGSPSAYLEKIKPKLNFKVEKYEVTNLDNIDGPVTEKMTVVIPGFDDVNAETLYFEPILDQKWGRNPFESMERTYPVDFGAPLENTFVLNLEYPENLQVEDAPGNAALTLPQSGGMYLFSVTQQSNRLVVNSRLQINRSLYMPKEYSSLRELFSRIVQVEGSQIVLKKKK